MNLREKVIAACKEAIATTGQAFSDEPLGYKMDRREIDDAAENAADAAIRTVLEALREPTQGMVMAGISERHEHPVPEAWSLATAHIWQAMLDQAIREHAMDELIAGDADLMGVPNGEIGG